MKIESNNTTRFIMKLTLLAIIIFWIVASRQFWLPDGLKSVPKRMIFSEKLYVRRDGLKDWLYPKIWLDCRKNLCLIDNQNNIILVIDNESGIFPLGNSDRIGSLAVDSSPMTPGVPRKTAYIDGYGFRFCAIFSCDSIRIENIDNSDYTINIQLQPNMMFIIKSADDIIQQPLKNETGRKLRELLDENSLNGLLSNNILDDIKSVLVYPCPGALNSDSKPQNED